MRLLSKNIFRHLVMTAVLVALPAAASLRAQENVAYNSYSPYTLFGIGDIHQQGTAWNKSMGGIGVGVRNNRFINYLNPAAASAIDTLSFMLDFGVQQKNTIYGGSAATGDALSKGDMSAAFNVFNIDHVIFTFPLISKSAIQFGITPASDVGYNFIANDTRDEVLANLGDVRYQKTGQGGIYQIFGGVGATFWKRLSIGAQGIYNFGTIDRYSYAVFVTDKHQRSITSGWNYILRGATAKFGVQYEQPVSKGSSIIVGGIYRLPQTLGMNAKRYAYAASSSSTDTIVNTKLDMDNIRIPQEIGAGISFKNREKFMIGFDYVLQDWSNTTLMATPDVDFRPARSESFKAGLEFTPNRYDIRYFFRTCTYRFGAYHNKSYYMLNGHQICATGFTFGMSIPVFRLYNAVSFGVDVGQRGSMDNALIRERYANFYLSVNLHDIWFQKTLYH